MVSANTITKELKSFGDVELARHAKRFFKTAKGEYGEGDKFLGIRVPVLRKLVTKYRKVELEEVELLLQSPFHEIRLFAALLLVKQFEAGDQTAQQNIYQLYQRNLKYINNWDIVDSSAMQIVGAWLWDKDRDYLYKLAKSQSLWERRVAIISTYYFIKKHDFDDTLQIATELLTDDHDLIHKAVGWMLREIGNRSMEGEENFLKVHYPLMPRTMLRYAIEKFPEDKRQAYLKGRI